VIREVEMLVLNGVEELLDDAVGLRRLDAGVDVDVDVDVDVAGQSSTLVPLLVSRSVARWFCLELAAMES